VNHADLLRQLAGFDAWALCLSSPSLRQILPLCPEDARVGAWVKPFASFKPGVRVAYAWEPVIFWGARKGTRKEPTIKDWVAESITLKRGLAGAKPRRFCWWLFEMLGAQPGDEMGDLFPGTGAVIAAWEAWCARRAAQRPLALAEGEEPA
jgi:hypothetical protein